MPENQQFLAKKEEKQLKTILTYLGIFLIVYLIFDQIKIALIYPSFYHPDEIYQTYEIGHYFYYGYGIRSWEWLYKGGSEFTMPPHNLGPYRSLITPLLFYSLFGIGELIGLDYWTQILPFIRVILGLNFVLGIIGLALILYELERKNKRTLPSWIIFLILIIIYPDTILYGTRGLTNVIGFFPLWWSLFLFLHSQRDNAKIQKIIIFSVLSGFLMGVSLWIRPDFVLLIFIFGILFFKYPIYLLKDGLLFVKRKYTNFSSETNNNLNLSVNTQNKISKSILYTLFKQRWVLVGIFVFIGGLTSFLFNGILDLIYWNDFAISIFNFIEFNSNTEYQSIWGTKPNGWFFEQYIVNRPTLKWLWILNLGLVLVTIIFILYFVLRYKKLPSTHMSDLIKIWSLFLIIIFVFLWWDGDYQPHKEIRYLLAWEYFFFAFSAFNLSFIGHHFAIFLVNMFSKFDFSSYKLRNLPKNYNIPVKGLISIIVISMLLIPYFNGLSVDAQRISLNNFDDVLASSVFVGQKAEDLKGLIIIGTFWYDGGFTYLHNNVSVIHIPSPLPNNSFNLEFKLPQLYNYAIVPHYKYLHFPSLKSNLLENNWVLNNTILGRTDVWYLA